MRNLTDDDAFAIGVFDQIFACVLDAALLFYPWTALIDKGAARRWSLAALLLTPLAAGMLVVNNQRTNTELERAGIHMKVYCNFVPRGRS